MRSTGGLTQKQSLRGLLLGHPLYMSLEVGILSDRHDTFESRGQFKIFWIHFLLWRYLAQKVQILLDRGLTSGFWERFPKPRLAGEPCWLQQPYKEFDDSNG